MLHVYPIQATQENWLHENICSLVRLVHQKLDERLVISAGQESWNSLVMQVVVPERQDFFLKSYGIRDRFFEYKKELFKLRAEKRSVVLETLESQNRIADLVRGDGQIKLVSIEPVALHDKAKKLFTFCYERLSDSGVRRRQYNIIFKNLENKICPFCGIDRMMDPEDTAQDQDHYLAKSIYPFAAVNLRNLVPMCRHCNRDHKKDINVILDGQNKRRKAFDPYDCDPPKISLSNSMPISNSSPINFNWDVKFLTSAEEAENWDRVFSIRKRYSRDILNNYFSQWLREFVFKCDIDRQRELIGSEPTDAEIRNQLANYHDYKARFPNIGNAGFLEPLVFELLLKLYDEGHEEITHIVRNAVTGVTD